MYRIAAVLVGLLAASTSFAQAGTAAAQAARDAIAEVREAAANGDGGPWLGKVTLGYLATSGNTDNSSTNVGFEVGYVSGKWLHQLRGRAIQSTQEEITNAENYQLGWLTNYDFSEKSYVFGRVGWLKDRFAGIVEQTSQTVGYGRRVFDTERHKLNAEIGGGARQFDSADGTSESEFIVRGGLDYTWAISENAEFSQGLIVEYGSSNTFTESITALKADLIGSLALVASYTIRNNSEVPAGTENTDTFTALSLEYGF